MWHVQGKGGKIQQGRGYLNYTYASYDTAHMNYIERIIVLGEAEIKVVDPKLAIQWNSFEGVRQDIKPEDERIGMLQSHFRSPRIIRVSLLGCVLSDQT